LVYRSPRVIAAAAGVVLILGPVALIQAYRGLSAPADAGTMPASASLALSRKDAGRLVVPAPEAGPAAERPAASLLLPPLDGYRQTFARPEAAPAPARPQTSPFLFEAATAVPPAGAPATRVETGAPHARAPAGSVETGAPPAKRRDRVTRSATCDGKMPEESWLDVCG
jgi:hypothetical protein